MKLYILRHGQTYFSKHHIPYGLQVETAEILPDGIPAIKRISEFLKKIDTDANFSSPFNRCRQTVAIVSEITQKKFEFDERLRDWIPEIEGRDSVILRVLDFAKELQKTNNKVVAICTHGYPINALIAYFTKGFVREADLDNHPECGVLSVITDRKVSYRDFNK